MRLIDANALKEWLTKPTGFRANCEDCPEIDCLDCIIGEAIDNAPTVDAVPVEHGKWLETDSAPHRVYCSKCYKTFVNNKNWLKSNGGSVDDAEYCPHCRAKMDGERRSE